MSSLDIFIENINRIALLKNLQSYRQIAEYLNVTEDALKHWKNKTRCPSLRQIDDIGDRINCYAYTLIQSNGEISREIDCVQNNSRKIFVENLRKYFIDKGRFSWNDKVALFYGFVSEDVLKSYFRKENYKTPPLKRLDEMAEALGIPTYKLIKESNHNEEVN
ncbi:hypothetical protein [Pseudobacteroides cellulosolvens]|uniref:HTH cro/C1-type domain-containing protein n=1 Tax=Pseudobacteroides cellulosolvens ATCC 35603 = DSM 2933 TaxID=398512 RepID=A0A0L6JXK0_9FIRM|nr:hypothetical protein [Pseudobacteroides cellulosolvens]KNY30474.1 hypothetical protein Bccel_5754 [Pseudobacteroides cellulosolvens ATCC 35603 = DSM 2933]